MSDNEESDIIDVNDGKVTHIESSGVTSGINMIPFHWMNRQTNKAIPMTMYALGKRNLEFRRAEATKAGYTLMEGHHTQHTDLDDANDAYETAKDNDGVDTPTKFDKNIDGW